MLIRNGFGLCNQHSINYIRYLISGVEDSHLEALGVKPDSAVAMQNLTEMSGKLVFLEKLIPQ